MYYLQTLYMAREHQRDLLAEAELESKIQEALSAKRMHEPQPPHSGLRSLLNGPGLALGLAAFVH